MYLCAEQSRAVVWPSEYHNPPEMRDLVKLQERAQTGAEEEFRHREGLLHPRCLNAHLLKKAQPQDKPQNQPSWKGSQQKKHVGAGGQRFLLHCSISYILWPLSPFGDVPRKFVRILWKRIGQKGSDCFSGQEGKSVVSLLGCAISMLLTS